jgi:galactonate dehydratase
VKIRDVVPWLVSVPGTFWGEYLFVEVRTEEGPSGWGEVTPTTRTSNRGIAAMLREVSTLLAGDDTTRIEDTWHKVFRAFTYAGSRGPGLLATSAVDIALWDLRGKELGVPIHELLGGRVRDELPIYTHPNEYRWNDWPAVTDELHAILESGHDAIKFDPFPHRPGQSIANDRYLEGGLSREDERFAADVTARVRAEVGADVEVLIDAHARFDVPTGIRLARRLQEEAAIDWFEEPVPPESVEALRQVREAVDVPIAVGERLHTRWDFAPIIRDRLADYLMPDVTWTGGISELKKIATFAETAYLPITPHDAAGPINLIAGAHVMLTVPNFYRMETSSYDLSSYDRFLLEPLDNRGGTLRVPDGPGLGLELDRERLEAEVVEGFGA